MAATNDHIYVSSVFGTNAGGTDTSQANQQTGDITNTSPDTLAASDVYEDLGAAVAGCAPSDGQTIYICDNHAATYDNGTNVALNATGASDGAGLRIISVLNTAIDSYSPGASENLSDVSDDFDLYYNGLIAGVNLETGDNILNSTTSTKFWHVYDSTIVVDGNGDWAIAVEDDGGRIHARNLNINTTASNITSGLFKVAKGSVLELNGGTLGGQGISGAMLSVPFGDGGGEFIANGYDFSLADVNLAATLNTTTTDPCLIRYNNCLLHANAVPPTPGTHLLHPFHRFEMFGCDNGTDKAFHRFFVGTGSGSAENSDTAYVTGNPAFFEGTAKSSIKVKTSSLCSLVKPFIFELPARYANLSDVGVSDTVSINIVTDFTLNDDDIAFFLMYPDGAVPVTANWLTSAQTASGFEGVDPLSAGAALNTAGALAAGDWTGEPAGSLFYKVNLDTAGDAGAACVPTVRVEVYKPSILGTTNTFLYIDPVLAVGT